MKESFTCVIGEGETTINFKLKQEKREEKRKEAYLKTKKTAVDIQLENK